MMSNQNDEPEEIETLLFDAIDSGDLETVKKILWKGVNNNQCLFNFGYTPLEYAVEKGELSIVQTMLSTGVNINAGATQFPLDIAVKAGRADITLAFLQAGAEVNLNLGDGWTLLMSAANAGHLSIVKLLVERGANINATTEQGVSALMCAAREGWQAVFNYLAPLSSPEIREQVAKQLPTGLLYPHRKNDLLINDFILAAGQGDVDVVRNAIFAGVDIDTVDTDGNSGLHLAILHDQLDVVRFLIEAGANIEIKHERYETTPLITAVTRGQLEIVQFLIDSGADVHVKHEGSTLLALAVEQAVSWKQTERKLQYMDIIKTLIRAGVDIKIKDFSGKTAIEIATHKGEIEIVQLIRKAGVKEN
ncbi:hypothetical protein F7734_43330 [Scytonema sp. UIC 10036]|uniref:ankyrin repeat domain-containing protein n=1 Tax=Scytonema sp. UIC 10036 TaxID=2304196 RepID=UPI0012DA3914|nr:ankyrin repeat domain-containing protein [Scytonema sp. UIC 10036]MUG98766.1 hypothetical protein [Scytonema sp. UIC 10036]